jgi:hypothetical protein
MRIFRKNVASQRWNVFAWDVTTGLPVTGDAANITANINIDNAGLGATDDVNPTEIEDGYYYFVMTAAEMNPNFVVDLYPESSTSNVQVVGIPHTTSPQTYAGNGRIEVDAASISNSTTTADSVQSNINNLDVAISSRTDTSDVTAALQIYGLDHLLFNAVTALDVTDNSVVAKLISKNVTASFATYNNTTDSLEAIRDNQATAPTAASIADAVWDEQKAGHVDANSFGNEIQLIKTDTSSTDIIVSGISSTVGDILVDTADIQPKIGTPSADLSADIAAIKSDTGAILTDTADIQPKLGTPATDISADIAAVKVDTGTIDTTTSSISSAVSDVETDTQDIQSRIPVALVTGRMDSNISAIDDSNESALDLAASAKTIVRGTAVTGTLSDTQMTTNLTELTDDHYIGRIIIWTAGSLKDQATDITDYEGVNGLLTFTTVTDIPSNNDTFVIV